MGGVKIRGVLKRVNFIFLLGSLLAGCSLNQTETGVFVEAGDRKIDHVHGLGYVGEKNELLIPTHKGLVKYSDGIWYETSTNKHDYKGFQVVNDGYYSSGHPENGTGLKNPLGLVKSSHDGKNLEKLSFYGETDFHFLAAGYYSHVIYAINEVPNSELYTGLFYSEDDGKTWKVSRLNGLTSKSISKIAVHPTKSEVIGISTKIGLFYSLDYGNNFELISKPNMVSSLHFEEESLLYSSIEEENILLYDLNLNTGMESKINLPELDNDNPIIEITSNPKNQDKLVLVTLKNDIFTTDNRGEEWEKIANGGKLETTV